MKEYKLVRISNNSDIKKSRLRMEKTIQGLLLFITTLYAVHGLWYGEWYPMSVVFMYAIETIIIVFLNCLGIIVKAFKGIYNHLLEILVTSLAFVIYTSIQTFFMWGLFTGAQLNGYILDSRIYFYQSISVIIIPIILTFISYSIGFYQYTISKYISMVENEGIKKAMKSISARVFILQATIILGSTVSLATHQSRWGASVIIFGSTLVHMHHIFFAGKKKIIVTSKTNTSGI